MFRFRFFIISILFAGCQLALLSSMPLADIDVIAFDVIFHAITTHIILMILRHIAISQLMLAINSYDIVILQYYLHIIACMAFIDVSKSWLTHGLILQIWYHYYATLAINTPAGCFIDTDYADTVDATVSASSSPITPYAITHTQLPLAALAIVTLMLLSDWLAGLAIGHWLTYVIDCRCFFIITDSFSFNILSSHWLPAITAFARCH